MKRFMVCCVVIVLLGVVSWCFADSEVFDSDGDALSFETLSSITASTGFTEAKLYVTIGGQKKWAKSALISVETASIRFTVDGTTPTVTAGTGAGHLMNVGDSYVIRGQSNIMRFRCINAVASSGAVVKVTYFF